MTFGTGLIVVFRDENIRRLHIAVNNPFLVSMLQRTTDRYEQLQAFPCTSGGVRHSNR